MLYSAHEHMNSVGAFEALTTDTINGIFWDIMTCNVVEVYKRFGGTYCLNLN
jgi:hypothetical protein